jgi:hypothetical protein
MGLLGRTGDRRERQHALAPDIVFVWAFTVVTGVMFVTALIVALMYLAGRVASVLTYGG